MVPHHTDPEQLFSDADHANVCPIEGIKPTPLEPRPTTHRVRNEVLCIAISVFQCAIYYRRNYLT